MLVTSLLLVINHALLVQICIAIGPHGPNWMNDPKFVQTVSLVGSLLLVMAQWWSIDRLTGWLFPRSEEGEPAGEEHDADRG